MIELGVAGSAAVGAFAAVVFSVVLFIVWSSYQQAKMRRAIMEHPGMKMNWTHAEEADDDD